ncbi:hypothetical protein RHGRI_004950 [Rhododendron griersonianum]|uniref:Helitron helicase-like domain-containing protein n=1 Tax=Rhododendron griersonianum TaxID=479676 RepID=A0AAV6LD78_9ERIC|nr:hypothetical protein RHGRI_004950 [Rhododendron griersonianum]
MTCSNCGAKMWIEEKVRDSPLSHPKFNLCCRSGQVVLPLLPDSPEFVQQKFNNAKFRENIRAYNSLLSFTSMGGKIDHSVLDGRGPYSFRISGANFHRIGSLLPEPGTNPKFAQLYIYDTEHETHNRMGVMRRTNGSTGIDTTTLEGLQSMLNVTNPYAQVFRSAGDIIRDNGAQDLRVRILSSRGGRQYTKPTTNEIAALLVGDAFESGANRDIVVQKLDGHLHRINETHPAYMPLQYPILFPYGTDGWRRSIEFTQATNANREGVSMREFYAFRLQFRDSEGKTLLQGGRLFQQFVVDCYAAIEQDRLNFVRCNQNILRSDLYSGLRDAVTAGDADASEVGTRFILPSSFTGGPRNMNQHYQDAMAVCRAMGFPDLLLTFTCNPSWSEIQQEVSCIPNQRTEDRPDILARVFRIKMKQLMRDIKKEKFFGKIIADIYVIEYQKRGLPHSHIILTLAAEDKLNSPEEIDEVICAEIPDEVNDPLAFETIMRCMIHGPCGDGNLSAPCMVNGKCSKHYPKKFSEQTTVDQNGFVIYRRRNYGKKYTVNGIEIDNRWVIPYNRDLIVKYNAHINLERCVHTKLIKYLYKYVHKGPDRATVVLENNVARTTGGGQCSYSMTDEVKQYLDCRYVSAIEACWRIFEFELQKQYPSVERLQYHLPGE